MPTLNDKIRKPDIQFGLLQIWIHGKQFQEYTDYWDGNWLIATIHCGSDNSDVWVKNEPALHLSQLQSLYKTRRNKKLILDPIEPYLELSFESNSSNKIEMSVEITPNVVEEKHSYLVSLDKPEYESGMRQLSEVLDKYLVVGKPD